jgi:histidinol phosphatase-like enzyme (inositol monophosphatase family)
MAPGLTDECRPRTCPGGGPMAEWLRRGLQILARRFDSGSGLQSFTAGHKMDQFEPIIRALADAARAETLPRWAEAGAADNKAADGTFDPVTEADRAAERAMRALIEREYPDHGISGEEYPDRPAKGPYGWSLDPIDGTRSFVCGLPSWVTLIALLEDRAPVMGLIDAPRLGERYLGYGTTALMIDAGGERAIATSGCDRLSEARLSSTDPALFEDAQAEAFARVRAQCRIVRYGHDGYAYARLAAGTIDLVVEAGLKPYDYNALIPLVRAAGGSIGNWEGGEDCSAGRIVAAATRNLFDEAVALLGG